MSDWKTRLFDNYISTGQTDAPQTAADIVNPYHEKLIVNILPSKKDIAIVDLACGHGRLIHNLKKSGYQNVLGGDISEEQVAAAHRLGLTEVERKSISQFVSEVRKESFDVAFLMDILEHLEPQETMELLDNVYKIIRNNGILVIHVPNGEGIFGMRMRYGDFTHRCAYTPQSIRQVLMACGFSEVRCLENKPIIHGIKSLFRYLIWEILTAPFRLLPTPSDC
jgi:2-polyprenyl-3-methyl-5-hydroxy-6-metoxy-1,4-benzoquinol methylase